MPNPGTTPTFSRLEAAREARHARYESAMARHDRRMKTAIKVAGAGLGVAVLYSILKK